MTTATLAAKIIKDSSWVRRSFLVTQNELDPTSNDFQMRIFTSALLKFTDTTPGGNYAINPPPQFTRYADPRATSQFTGSAGMGRYYSEAIDDNSQVIHMRMGVEEFNSLTNFFTGFYNSSAGQLARTGRGDGMFTLLGQAIGFVVQLASWKLLAVHFLGVATEFFLKKQSTKFYYLKPTMPLYWNAVSTILNHIAVNRGIVPRLLGDDAKTLDKDYSFTPDQITHMHNLLPTIFHENGGIDIYAVANRAKRLERQRMKQVQDKLDGMDNLTTVNIQQAIREIYTKGKLTDKRPELNNNDTNKPGYLQRWFGTAQAKPNAGTNEAQNTTEQVNANDKETGTLIKFMAAELDDGAAFASFRVNATGPVNESFSNSSGESELSSKINGMAAQARSANFSFADGNLIGGAAGAVIGEVTDKLKDLANGVLDSVNMSGLMTLAGAAFVDIPKYWQSSIASLPRMSYTMNLVSPYGNALSQLLNLDIPLAMILAAALPKSTGPQSHVGPFIIEVYDRGRCQTRLGILESLSVTRGTGNIGFNNSGHALGMDISFTIADMSSIMHMPITESFTLLGAVAQTAGKAVAGTTGQAVAAAATSGGAFSDDTVFSDYMAILSGMALNDQIYNFRKLKLNLTRQMSAYANWTSPSHFASFAGDTFPAKVMSMFYRGTDLR